MTRNKERESNKEIKTYCIETEKLRRHKLTPADLTIIQLGLESLKLKGLDSLEDRRKSLLNRMKGDFFMVLYFRPPENGKRKSRVTPVVSHVNHEQSPETESQKKLFKPNTTHKPHCHSMTGGACTCGATFEALIAGENKG